MEKPESCDKNVFWSAVYQEYQPKFIRYFMIRTRVLENAEDLTQSLFEKFWKMDFNYIKEEVDSFEGFLFRVARNTYYDFLRKELPRKTLPLIEGLDSFEGLLWNPHNTNEVQMDWERVKGHLSQPEWDCLNLKLQGYTYEEISKMRKKKKHDTRNLLHRVRIKIKIFLAQEDRKIIQIQQVPPHMVVFIASEQIKGRRQ